MCSSLSSDRDRVGSLCVGLFHGGDRARLSLCSPVQGWGSSGINYVRGRSVVGDQVGSSVLCAVLSGDWDQVCAALSGDWDRLCAALSRDRDRVGSSVWPVLWWGIYWDRLYVALLRDGTACVRLSNNMIPQTPPYQTEVFTEGGQWLDPDGAGVRDLRSFRAQIP